MKVKCINNDFTDTLGLGIIYDATILDSDLYAIIYDNVLIGNYARNRFEVIEEPTQIIDLNGIQTEPFTPEQKKVIAVEKDIKKNEIYSFLLISFKTANELQRIALLEIFEEMGYPQTDMVKLYRKFQNEL